jgi:DNA-binding NtrC family response regulator
VYEKIISCRTLRGLKAAATLYPINTAGKNYSPALVFLDLRLPSMSGMEVLRLIRSIDESAKVILISGYGTRESTEAALRLGALEFVEKTAHPDKMIQNIQRAVRKANAHLAI